jgi:hypothetical protein
MPPLLPSVWFLSARMNLLAFAQVCYLASMSTNIDNRFKHSTYGMCLSLGIRSVPLKGLYNEPLELSSLLIEITTVTASNSDLQTMVTEIARLTAERDELLKKIVRAGRPGAMESTEVHTHLFFV